MCQVNGFFNYLMLVSINKCFIFRYRASTHYRPELTPTERAHKLTLLLQHAAMLIRHTVQDRSTDKTSQAFWLANASELLHFLKSDRHVSAFSLQAQDTLADAVQLAFKVRTQCFFIQKTNSPWLVTLLRCSAVKL